MMVDLRVDTPEGEHAAYVRGLRDAAASLVMDNQTIRLHAGELSPDEMRCVRAVLKWKRWEILERAEKGTGMKAEQATP